MENNLNDLWALEDAFKYPIILDTHNDTMLRIIDENTWLPIVDLGQDTPYQIDIPKLKSGGLNIPFFAAYTEGYGDNTARSISRTLALIYALYFTAKKNSQTFKIAKDFKHIVSIVNQGKIAALPSIEGAYSLDRDYSFELLHQYKDLGIAAITLTWNYSNKIGEGAYKTYNDEKKTPSSGGLTKFGEKVVLEMNRLGILVDISHADKDTFWDVMRVSKSPIIASHSGIDAIKSHKRNLDDKQLKALAASGGIINIVYYPGFLKDSKDVYISDIVDHIDYAVNLIGIDHVGLGSDFDGEILPKDLKNASEVYKIKEELGKRNYKEKDIEKILGMNMLRLLKNIEDNSGFTKERSSSSINIIPDYKMGEAIDRFKPNLTAKVESKNKIIEASIIVDGIRYKALYNEEDATMSINIKEALKEKFHIVTFEIEDEERNINRESIIFYFHNK